MPKIYVYKVTQIIMYWNEPQAYLLLSQVYLSYSQSHSDLYMQSSTYKQLVPVYN